MESKQAGVLLAMLYALEQESQSTCRNFDPQEQKLIKDLILSLHQDQLIRKKYTQH